MSVEHNPYLLHQQSRAIAELQMEVIKLRYLLHQQSRAIAELQMEVNKLRAANEKLAEELSKLKGARK